MKFSLLIEAPLTGHAMNLIILLLASTAGRGSLELHHMR